MRNAAGVPSQNVNACFSCIPPNSGEESSYHTREKLMNTSLNLQLSHKNNIKTNVITGHCQHTASICYRVIFGLFRRVGKIVVTRGGGGGFLGRGLMSIST